MSVFKARPYLKFHIALFFSAFPVMANADADTAFTVGTGPDDYRFYAFKVNADIFSLPLQLKLDHFQSQATGVNDMKQSGAGLNWDATNLLSVNYRYSTTSDGTFDVKGNEGGFSFGLDTLWDGNLSTTLDLGYGAFDYAPTSIARAKLASKLSFTQNRKSIGLTQDITPTLSISGSHDQYDYDRNVRPDALNIIKLVRQRIVTAKVVMLSYPDKTNAGGIIWKPLEWVTLDISTDRTTTLLEQHLANTRLGVDFQINDSFNLTAAATRTTASTVTDSSSGTILRQSTSDTYSELAIGWSF